MKKITETRNGLLYLFRGGNHVWRSRPRFPQIERHSIFCHQLGGRVILDCPHVYNVNHPRNTTLFPAWGQGD
ncbi:MAG UNVERIFIED_CONTAM: hypothetical protein LVT10_23770 [Anaerolineae bacterium]